VTYELILDTLLIWLTNISYLNKITMQNKIYIKVYIRRFHLLGKHFKKKYYTFHFPVRNDNEIDVDSIITSHWVNSKNYFIRTQLKNLLLLFYSILCCFFKIEKFNSTVPWRYRITRWHFISIRLTKMD